MRGLSLCRQDGIFCAALFFHSARLHLLLFRHLTHTGIPTKMVPSRGEGSSSKKKGRVLFDFFCRPLLFTILSAKNLQLRAMTVAWRAFSLPFLLFPLLN